MSHNVCCANRLTCRMSGEDGICFFLPFGCGMRPKRSFAHDSHIKYPNSYPVPEHFDCPSWSAIVRILFFKKRKHTLCTFRSQPASNFWSGLKI
jgi:hypothetical protein